MVRSLILTTLPLLMYTGTWITLEGEKKLVPCPTREQHVASIKVGEPFRLPQGCVVQEPVVAYGPQRSVEVRARFDDATTRVEYLQTKYEDVNAELLTCREEAVDVADECVTLVTDTANSLTCPKIECSVWGDRAIGALVSGAFCTGFMLSR